MKLCKCQEISSLSLIDFLLFRKFTERGKIFYAICVSFHYCEALIVFFFTLFSTEESQGRNAARSSSLQRSWVIVEWVNRNNFPLHMNRQTSISKAWLNIHVLNSMEQHIFILVLVLYKYVWLLCHDCRLQRTNALGVPYIACQIFDLHCLYKCSSPHPHPTWSFCGQGGLRVVIVLASKQRLVW